MMRMGRVTLPSGKLAVDALYEYALRALARRSHTKAELERKIQRRSASVEDVRTVLDRLRRHGYLDDAQVAETHSTMRRDIGVFGPKRVLLELKRRGVADQTAETAVSDAYHGRDESELARAHLRRKMGAKPVDVQDVKEVARLYRSLVRAGFRRSAIADALGDVAPDTEWFDDVFEDEVADGHGG